MTLQLFSHGLLSALFKQGALAHEINSELLSLLSPVCDALGTTLMDNKRVYMRKNVNVQGYLIPFCRFFMLSCFLLSE